MGAANCLKVCHGNLGDDHLLVGSLNGGYDLPQTKNTVLVCLVNYQQTNCVFWQF